MKEMDDGTVYLVGVTDQMLSIGLAPGPTASTLNVVNSNKPRGSKEIPVARFSIKHPMVLPAGALRRAHDPFGYPDR